MIEAWLWSLFALFWSFIFWIVGGRLLDAAYTYSFESMFVMNAVELSAVKGLYAAWDYLLLFVIGIILLFNVTYTTFKR